MSCGGSSAAPSAVTNTKRPSESEPKEQAQVPVVVPGVDTSTLSADDTRRWQTLLRELQAPCGTKASVAACIETPLACSNECIHAARYASRLVGEGYADQDIAVLHGLRFDPKAAVELSLQGAPAKGSEHATATIVVFSDFECPYCAVAAAMLDRLLNNHKDTLRVVMKHFPLPQHEMAFPAAKASVTAGLQGKFWPMHDALFKEQSALSMSFFEKQAKAIGLNVNQFRKDMRSEATEAQVNSDMEEAKRLGIRGTPTLFINGRYYAEPLESLPKYLDETLAP